jgi:hypothetical protein
MRSLALSVLLCCLGSQLAAGQKLTGNLTSGITCTTGKQLSTAAVVGWGWVGEMQGKLWW